MINEIILTTGSAHLVFDEALSLFGDDQPFHEDGQIQFLNRCKEKLPWESAQKLIDNVMHRKWPFGELDSTEVFGELDIPDDDTDHLTNDQINSTAHDNWVRRRERELWDILCGVHQMLDIPAPVNKETVGLSWAKGTDHELDELVVALSTNGLVECGDLGDLVRTFNGTKPKMNPPIHWMNSRKAFCYFIWKLKTEGLIHSDLYDSQIREGCLFTYSLGDEIKFIGSITKSVSHFEKDEKPIPKNQKKKAVYDTIDAIVDHIASLKNRFS